MRLMHGDCLERMKDIPDESVDCIVTDCPYKLISGGCKGRRGGFFDESNPGIRSGKLFDYNSITFDEWLPDVYRVLKDGTHAYIMITGRNISKLQTAAEKVGFKFVNLLVWEKNNVTVNRYYMNKTEFVLLLRKGKARSINNVGTANVLHVSNIIGSKLHPTQKPLELMEIFVTNSTNGGDIVLDPFMGVGSTGVACVQTGRDFIGIELDDKYYAIAEKRIYEAQNALNG